MGALTGKFWEDLPLDQLDRAGTIRHEQRVLYGFVNKPLPLVPQAGALV